MNICQGRKGQVQGPGQDLTVPKCGTEARQLHKAGASRCRKGVPCWHVARAGSPRSMASQSAGSGVSGSGKEEGESGGESRGKGGRSGSSGLVRCTGRGGPFIQPGVVSQGLCSCGRDWLGAGAPSTGNDELPGRAVLCQQGRSSALLSGPQSVASCMLLHSGFVAVCCLVCSCKACVMNS